MNVVIAALSAPVQLNGVTRHAINLARALLSVRRITGVHVLAGSWQREMFESGLNGVDTRLHTHWMGLADANLSRLFWYQRELPYIAAQLEADVVHLTFPAPIAERAFHCPTVLSLHDLYPFDLPENFGFWKSMLGRRIVRRCIRRVDGIACVSASTRMRLAHWFPEQERKAVVVPNGVELTAPRPPSECSMRSLKEHPFVLCVAQHRCNKNLTFAVRVFERLIERRILHSDSRLVIVGNPGPETKKIIRQMKESRLTGKVLLLSGLSDPVLRWCYENCVLLLAPSTIEGFGLPVAEGMLAGCRIVCSDIQAFREVGGDECRFVPFGGAVEDAYVEAIRESLTGPKPSATSASHFCLSVIGKKYSNLYETLVCSQVPEFDMLRQLEGEPNTAEPLGSRSA